MTKKDNPKNNENLLQLPIEEISQANDEEIQEENDLDVGIEVIVLDGGKLPEYKTDGASGLDVYARLYDIENPSKFNPRRYEHPEINEDNTVIIYPGRQVIIASGIKANIPYGFEIQVRGRSGLAAKNMIGITNGIGTIRKDCMFLGYYKLSSIFR